MLYGAVCCCLLFVVVRLMSFVVRCSLLVVDGVRHPASLSVVFIGRRCSLSVAVVVCRWLLWLYGVVCCLLCVKWCCLLSHCARC